VYQRDFTDKQLEATPTTPGMKYRHYSPTAPLLLLDPTPAWHAQQQQRQQREEQQQQLDTSVLQQLVVEATQQLLRDIQQAQQQQQQQLPCSGSSEHHSASGRQVVVLLSTCSSSSSSGSGVKPGWTPASLECIHQQQQEGSAAALKGLCSSSSSPESSVQMLEYVLGSWQQPELVAQHMFAALRAADAVCPALIIAQGLPPQGPGLAIMNRLQKAASQHVQVPVGL
jgi:L-threonylcarbamoyladenylate synthase